MASKTIFLKRDIILRFTRHIDAHLQAVKYRPTRFSLYPNNDIFEHMPQKKKQKKKLSNEELFSFQPVHKKNTNSS